MLHSEKNMVAPEPQALVCSEDIVAFPYNWQLPAATEKAAYESIARLSSPLGFEYFGFPWATIIDGLRGNAASAAQILMALRVANQKPKKAARRVTVAQHIHAMEFIDLFKASGITDIFWSHATHKQLEIDGISLHPFPLFPAQTPEASLNDDPRRPRRYLANFIGAYNPNIYLTNVREVIFNDPNSAGDLLIIKRDAWHFDRAVYEEQIKGRAADVQRLLTERKNTEEYLNAIKDSWFTLCPSGSGPNSIRIYESLCLGSIPIVLTRDLKLPGPQAIWEKAAIIEEDSAVGYQKAISLARNTSLSARYEMLRFGERLFADIEPKNFCKLIVGGINL